MAKNSRKSADRKEKERTKKNLVQQLDYTRKHHFFSLHLSIYSEKEKKKKREMGWWKREREGGENAERIGWRREAGGQVSGAERG